MLIMLLAHARASGDGSYISKYVSQSQFSCLPRVKLNYLSLVVSSTQDVGGLSREQHVSYFIRSVSVSPVSHPLCWNLPAPTESLRTTSPDPTQPTSRSRVLLVSMLWQKSVLLFITRRIPSTIRSVRFMFSLRSLLMSTFFPELSESLRKHMAVGCCPVRSYRIQLRRPELIMVVAIQPLRS